MFIQLCQLDILFFFFNFNHQRCVRMFLVMVVCDWKMMRLSTSKTSYFGETRPTSFGFSIEPCFPSCRVELDLHAIPHNNEERPSSIWVKSEFSLGV